MKLEQRVTILEQKVEEILQTLPQQRKKQKIARGIPHEDTKAVKLYAQILRGVSNPIRVAILNKLTQNGSYYHELEKLTGMTSAPLSFHLKTLKSSGLIRQDSKRGKYLITELGLKLLEMIDQIAKTLYEFETIELDRHCFLCGEAKMKIDVFPIHFRLWCPKCGGNHGAKWSFSLLNPFGEEWPLYGVEKLVEMGWKESSKLMKEAVRSGRCINCNAQVEYTFHDDRIEGKCPLCDQHYSMQINDLTPSRLFPLWKKYKKIRQKTEGPVEKKGIPCWKITVSDERGRVIAVQHVKVGEGKEVAWKEL